MGGRTREIPFTFTASLDEQSFARSFNFIEARSKRVAAQMEKNLGGSFNAVEARAEKVAREQIKTDSLAAREQMKIESLAAREFEKREFEKLKAAEATARGRIKAEQDAALAAMKFDRQRSLEAERLMREESRTNATLAREQIKTESLAAREFQKQEREKMKTAEAAARSAANAYEKELGSGFFGRLGSRAIGAFKKTFGLNNDDMGGGIGSMLGGFVGGNIIFSAISKITGGIKDLVMAGINFNDEFKRAHIRLTTITEDSKGAYDRLQELKALAVDKGLEFQPLVEAEARLRIVGLSAELTKQTINSAADAAAALGGGADKLEQIVSVFERIADKSSLASREIRQLENLGLPVFKILAEKTGLEESELKKLSDAGRLRGDVSLRLLNEGFEQRYGGLAEQLAKTTYSGSQAALSEAYKQRAGQGTYALTDEVTGLQAQLTQALKGQKGEAVASGINSVTSAVLEKVNGLFDALSSGSVEKLEKLGLDAATSAASGVNQGAKALYEAGSNAANQVEQGWRDKAVQHSPSQVMYQLGFDASFSAVHGFNDGLRHGRGTTRAEIEQFIQEAAERFKVPAELIESIIKNESHFHVDALSPKGAEGLMQLMPATAARYGVTNAFDARQNIMGGTAYLADLLQKFHGDIRLVAAAYNAGEGAVKKYGGVPPFRETKNYVKDVAQDYTRLSSGATSPVPVQISNIQPFQEWLSHLPGAGYKPELALGHTPPERPASRDITGGVGMFVGDFNPRGFAEWLYYVEKNRPTSEHTTVQEQADYQHAVSMMADQTHISRAQVQMIQDLVSARLEQERAMAAQGAADGGHFRPDSPLASVTSERVLEIARGNVKELKQDAGLVAVSLMNATAAAKASVGADVQAQNRNALITSAYASEIADLKEKLSEVGQDTAGRFQVAWLKAIIDVRDADYKAVEAEIAARVKLADGMTVHVEQARSKIIGYLAEQKSMTEAWADGVTSSFQQIFDVEDKAIDKLTHGVKIADELLKSFVHQLESRLITKFIDAILGPQTSSGQQSAGAQSSGGGFGLKNVLGGIFSGGGGGQGGGVFNSGSIFNSGGIIKNFRANGFIGGLKNLFGFGSSAAAAAAAVPTGASAAGAGGLAAGVGALSGMGIGAAGAGAGAAAAGAGAAGAAGASAGMFSGLAPLLTNPWTAVVAGGIIGGLLLFNHFSHATEKKLQSAIRSMYGVDYHNDWKSLDEIKAIGESSFGKGQVSKHIFDTIRLDPVKQLIEQYAVSTNQTNSSLVQNQQLANASNPANNFTRREFGGSVSPWRDYLVGERRAEVFSPDVPGHIYPSVDRYEEARKRMVERVRKSAAVSPQALPSNTSAQSQGGGIPPSMMVAIMGALKQAGDAIQAFHENVKSVSPGHVFQAGAKEKPRVVADSLRDSLSRGYRKPAIQRNLNLG